MIIIVEEYAGIKRLKVQNNILTNKNNNLVCFETKEEVQRVKADINQYSGWKASLYCNIHTIQENREESQTEIQTTDTNEMECHVWGLKVEKIIKTNVNQNKASALEA